MHCRSSSFLLMVVSVVAAPILRQVTSSSICSSVIRNCAQLYSSRSTCNINNIGTTCSKNSGGGNCGNWCPKIQTTHGGSLVQFKECLSNRVGKECNSITAAHFDKFCVDPESDVNVIDCEESKNTIETDPIQDLINDTANETSNEEVETGIQDCSNIQFATKYRCAEWSSHACPGPRICRAKAIREYDKY